MGAARGLRRPGEDRHAAHRGGEVEPAPRAAFGFRSDLDPPVADVEALGERKRGSSRRGCNREMSEVFV